MRIHVPFVAGLLKVSPAMIASAAPSQNVAAPGWIADPRSGCRVWNVYPNPGEAVSRSGAGRDGYGVIVSGNGNRYESELHDNRPNARLPLQP